MWTRRSRRHGTTVLYTYSGGLFSRGAGGDRVGGDGQNVSNSTIHNFAGFKMEGGGVSGVGGLFSVPG